MTTLVSMMDYHGVHHVLLQLSLCGDLEGKSLIVMKDMQNGPSSMSIMGHLEIFFGDPEDKGL